MLIYETANAALQNAKAVYDWMNTVLHARAFTKTRIEKKSAGELDLLMSTLGNSTRRCMNPVDYVYGVLGILQIKIPRMDDPSTVWQSFLCEFDKYIDIDMKEQMFGYRQITGISDRARQVNLQEVEHMGDVYKDFLTTVTDHVALYKFTHRSVVDRVFDRCRIQ